MATKQYYEELQLIITDEQVTYPQARMIWRKIKRNNKTTKNKSISSSMEKYWTDVIAIMSDDKVTKDEARNIWRQEHE